MLLAAGVYPAFIAAIAEFSTAKFRVHSVVLLASIVGAAVLGIVLLAGSVKNLVESYRWVMYSLFIGLTLGGVPLIWKLARPATPAVAIAAACAFALMVLMAFSGGAAGSGSENLSLLFASGVAAASAMILPGVSGGYLLLLLGQYENILGTIDQLKLGVLGNASLGRGLDVALVLDALSSLLPLGLGVVVGVVGVSNALQWMLERFEKATLGALLGLLLGAVVGLWPFVEPVAPAVGDIIKGRPVTKESLHEIESDDWQLVRFAPTQRQLGGSLALVITGLVVTTAIGRLGTAADNDASLGSHSAGP